MAAGIFRQEILWPQIRKLALPIFAGIAAGSIVLYYLPRDAFPPLVGWMVLGMLSLQAVRHFRTRLAEGLPHSTWFLWTVGLVTGISTMIANAAGPIATLYLLLVGLPKKEFIATMAWLFLFVNLAKVPFSLALNLILLPAVATGLLAGRLFIERLPQRLFMWIILSFAAISAVKLIWFTETAKSAVLSRD
jgi:uncharacterized membrane protein YfcA